MVGLLLGGVGGLSRFGVDLGRLSVSLPLSGVFPSNSFILAVFGSVSRCISRHSPVLGCCLGLSPSFPLNLGTFTLRVQALFQGGVVSIKCEWRQKRSAIAVNGSGFCVLPCITRSGSFWDSKQSLEICVEWGMKKNRDSTVYVWNLDGTLNGSFGDCHSAAEAHGVDVQLMGVMVSKRRVVNGLLFSRISDPEDVGRLFYSRDSLDCRIYAYEVVLVPIGEFDSPLAAGAALGYDRHRVDEAARNGHLVGKRHRFSRFPLKSADLPGKLSEAGNG